MRLSNCGVFTMIISIFAFCTGLSRPASSVVSRPVVISARSSHHSEQRLPLMISACGKTHNEPPCLLLCVLTQLACTPHAACANSAHQCSCSSAHLCDKP